jgi:hypothetical protein
MFANILHFLRYLMGFLAGKKAQVDADNLKSLDTANIIGERIIHAKEIDSTNGPATGVNVSNELHSDGGL